MCEICMKYIYIYTYYMYILHAYLILYLDWTLPFFSGIGDPEKPFTFGCHRQPW